MTEVLDGESIGNLDTTSWSLVLISIFLKRVSGSGLYGRPRLVQGLQRFCVAWNNNATSPVQKRLQQICRISIFLECWGPKIIITYQLQKVPGPGLEPRSIFTFAGNGSRTRGRFGKCAGIGIRTRGRLGKCAGAGIRTVHGCLFFFSSAD